MERPIWQRVEIGVIESGGGGKGKESESKRRVIR